MVIYQLINPENKTITVIAYDFFEAIQKAKKIDNYKFTEIQYVLICNFVVIYF